MTAPKHEAAAVLARRRQNAEAYVDAQIAAMARTGSVAHITPKVREELIANALRASR